MTTKNVNDCELLCTILDPNTLPESITRYMLKAPITKKTNKPTKESNASILITPPFLLCTVQFSFISAFSINNFKQNLADLVRFPFGLRSYRDSWKPHSPEVICWSSPSVLNLFIKTVCYKISLEIFPKRTIIYLPVGKLNIDNPSSLN